MMTATISTTRHTSDIFDSLVVIVGISAPMAPRPAVTRTEPALPTFCLLSMLEEYRR